MVFQLPTVFGRKAVPDLPFLIARSRELDLAISAAETHLATLRTDRLRIDAIADEAGLGKQLAAALAPPPPAPVIQYTRVRALKPYKILWRGPHGAEEYSGGPNSVNDVPSELLSKLKGRVEPVGADVEIFGVPLKPEMRTDD